MRRKIGYNIVALCVIVLILIIVPFTVSGQSTYIEDSDVTYAYCGKQAHGICVDDKTDDAEYSEPDGIEYDMFGGRPLTSTYTNDGFESLILEMQQQLDDLQLQVQDLQLNVHFLWDALTGGQPDETALMQQIAQTAATERFIFKVEYYNMCALISGSYLLERHIALVERQLEVERVRLSLGEVTQISVDVLTAQLSGLRRQSISKSDELQTRQHLIDGKRGLPGFDFIGNYTIPTPSLPRVRTLDALKAALISSNASVDAYDRQISHQNEIIDALVDMGAADEIINAYRVELRHMTAERGLLVSQLTTTATNRWFSYLDAKTQFDLAEVTRPMLIAQLELISTLYDLGEISTVEKLRQELSIYEELHKADMAAVALAIEIAQINIMADGIVV